MKPSLIVFLICFSPAAWSFAPTLGFVDMEKVFRSTPAGKKAREQWQKRYDKTKEELSRKEADLKKAQEDLELKKTVMTEEAFAAKQKDFQEMLLKFREVVTKSQEEMQKLDRELAAPVIEKIKVAAQKIVQEKALSGIIELSPAVVAYNPEADVTALVIKAVNN